MEVIIIIITGIIIGLIFILQIFYIFTLMFDLFEGDYKGTRKHLLKSLFIPLYGWLYKCYINYKELDR